MYRQTELVPRETGRKENSGHRPPQCLKSTGSQDDTWEAGDYTGITTRLLVCPSSPLYPSIVQPLESLSLVAMCYSPPKGSGVTLGCVVEVWTLKYTKYTYGGPPAHWRWGPPLPQWRTHPAGSPQVPHRRAPPQPQWWALPALRHPVTVITSGNSCCPLSSESALVPAQRPRRM